MKARVLGLNHDLQWKDTTGNHLTDLLKRLLTEEDADLIAEEATALPTTVAQRLACRLNKPWLNADMDECQRRAAGIYDELVHRPHGPLFDENGEAGTSEGYLPHADGIREKHWASQIFTKYKSKSAIILCGLIHLSPLAETLRRYGHQVEEINVCNCDWSIKEFGKVRIVEAGGNRWSEHYRPGRHP